MYQPNNIEFRIASADAISKFKATQAHSFLQVCRREFDFDISSREVVLLSYDRFSLWLLKLEKSFLAEHGKTPTPKMIRLAYDMFAEELDKIEATCMENPDVFKDEVCKIVHVIHDYTRHIMANAVSVVYNKSVPAAFAILTGLVSDYLQHVLIAMHEFNNNILLKKDPFICVSKFSLLAKTPRLVSIRSRAEYYRERLDKTATFTVKNYTDEDITEEMMKVLGDMGIFAKVEELEESSL